MQKTNRRLRTCVMLLCLVVQPLSGWTALHGQDSPAPAAVIPPEQLDSLVAPIALYPDELLAQTLVASTYPLEIVQLQQWMDKNPGLEDDALKDAVAEQPWDPSIQSMAVVPDVVTRLADDIQWATELGNAFLAQQADVMDAVQRMRKKAQDQGALESNEQQVVETQVIEKETVIIVEAANPEVIYVPSYSPTVVYGAPIYPYPPIYYPPYVAGTAFVAFSVGFIWGAAWGGSCCGVGWGHNDINININNDFNRIDARGSGNWSHDPQHRGGAPYADRTTADKFGGTARGDSLSSRQPAARDQTSRQTGTGRDSGAATAGTQRTGASSTRAGTQGAGDFSSSRGSGGGADSIGSRNIPSSGGFDSGAFGGGGGSYSGSSARASSMRGSGSMGGGRGGGGGRR